MKYTYRLEEDCDIDDINKFSEEGWELVAVMGSDVSAFGSEKFYFRKLIK